MSIKIVKKCCSNEEMEKRLGEYPTEEDYDFVIRSNTDVITSDGKTICKFRKNIMYSPAFAREFEESVRNYSKHLHENRGASAGRLEYNRVGSHARDGLVKSYDEGAFRSKYHRKCDGKISNSTTCNQSPSNVIGFWDLKDRNIPSDVPCRQTAFNKRYPEKFEKTLPYLEELSKKFKKILPGSWEKQKQRCDLHPKFVIPNTVFTTVTLNYSNQTGIHRDAGDWGMACLSVIKDSKNRNDYLGCLLVFPQYRFAVDILENDLLVANTHDHYHGNTAFKQVLDKPDNHNGGFSDRHIKNSWHYNRLSMVCYIREKMSKCNEKI